MTITTKPHFLAIDIETGGPNKPIFAIGCVLFQIENKQMITIEEKLFSYAPTIPKSNIVETNETNIQVENINYGDFDINTWDKFWLKHQDTLKYISSISEYLDEQSVINAFYSWWLITTKNYHNLRIISDNPSFDIGYLDSRISLNRIGKTAKPLANQWRGKNWYYVTPLDQFSIEWIILCGQNGKQCLESIYQLCPVQSDHNPINDAKTIGWKFCQLVNYLT